ncbi:hypothetical protein [Serinicoccus marinus]|uniref:hypothetical protein n=1 Tax=Serinicoccus marinus TaxID=247333 RepID=UPI0003B4DEB1|nr:hypothetical protein [Serinicoccus marinus]
MGGLLVSACAAGPSYTLGGREVSELEGSLADIDSAWQASIGQSDTEVNVPEEAACYFQARDPDDRDSQLSPEVLCGPYRALGSAETSWDSAELTSYFDGNSEQWTVHLAPTDLESPFRSSQPSPNLIPFRPDGEEADLAADVKEPDAPKATAGDVIEIATTDAVDLQLESVDDLRSPNSRFDVALGNVGRITQEGSPLDAPDGGAFVIASITGEQSSWSEDPDEVSFQVIGQQETFDLGSQTGTYAVAVSEEPESYSFAMEFAGLTQMIDAQGNRQSGTAADALYEELPSVTVASLSDSVGDDSSSGFVAEARSGWGAPEARLSPYARETGWAPDGQVWLLAEGQVDVSSVRNTIAEGETAYYDVQEVEVTRVTIGDNEVEEISTEKSRSTTEWSLVHPVAADFDELSLAVDVHALVLKADWPDVADAPDRGELDFSLEGPITQ